MIEFSRPRERQQSGNTDSNCPVCGNSNHSVLLQIRNIPVYCNQLYPTYRDAIDVGRGDLILCYCETCGHAFNSAFEAGKLAYDVAYENSLHFSPRFRQFSDELARRLISEYSVTNKFIVDVGCGDGNFLQTLCELGDNTGVGFDPSFQGYHPTSEQRWKIVSESYSVATAQQYPPDFLCCRHVLEHVELPREFLIDIRKSLRPGVHVYFEVPNTHKTYEDGAIWDLIYEHVSFFSESSLQHVFRSAGFEVLNISEYFGNQYLGVDAFPDFSGKPAPVEIEPLEKRSDLAITSFPLQFFDQIENWNVKLNGLLEDGKKIALWGAGSKGVSILNFLERGAEVSAVVDVNPKKHGKYVSGTGQLIISPRELRDFDPDFVGVTNELYLSEIAKAVSDLNLQSELLLV